MRLTIATSQFPVADAIDRNRNYILRHMRLAKEGGADVVHFCEGALSGYAGNNFTSFRNFDWGRLRTSSEQVLAEAQALGIWVLLGSAHRLSAPHRPHNSIYVIDPGGRIVERYDKMFCSGDSTGRTGDLSHYSPGDHFCTFDVNGVRCGVMVCYDFRFSELYREYTRHEIQVLFHSFNAGRVSEEHLATNRERLGVEELQLSGATTIPGAVMPATSVAAAAHNHLWISCSNTSAKESCWPAFVVRPDGITSGRLRRNVSGVLFTEVDTDAEYYDSTAAWRGRGMSGVLHSGKLVHDPRSEDRTTM